MRVLIAGYAPEDSFADNVRCVLEEMGHEVTTLGIVAPRSYYTHWRHIARSAREQIFRRTVETDGRKLLRLARRFRPDMVLALTREYQHEALFELKRISHAVLILWWGDPPANMRRLAVLEPLWDLIFMKDAIAVEKTKLVRSDVYLLHEAMNPRWHRPIGTQGTSHLAVVGNWYGFRQALVRRLLNDGVAVDCYGSPPPVWSFPEVIAIHKRRYIVREEKSRIFGEALACLNSFQYAEGDSLNCRAFEIAGAGGLQLIEYRPAISQCFEPGRELLVFRNYEELLDLVERARQAPEDMIRIREAGARRALAEHTYRHRLGKIFGYLK